jgi:hypothetical protein
MKYLEFTKCSPFPVCHNFDTFLWQNKYFYYNKTSHPTILFHTLQPNRKHAQYIVFISSLPAKVEPYSDTSIKYLIITSDVCYSVR